MPQPQYKSNAELKFLAKIQTSKHFGILLGSTLLNYIITFMAINFVSALIPVRTTTGYIINYVLVFIVQVAASILNVGTSFIFLKSACDMSCTISDLFCGFQNHTAKILKIGALIVAVESISMIPVDVFSLQLTNAMASVPLFNESNINELSAMLATGSFNSTELIEAYSILYGPMMRYYLSLLVCTALSFILTMPFFPAFYMILDFPDRNVSTILKRCFEVMSGNKLRLFMLYLGFVPLYLLSVFTCGLTLIWIFPYQKMAATNFYLDIMSVRNKNKRNNSVPS